MGDFIAQYWLQFGFGLIAAAIMFAIRQYFTLKEKVWTQDQANFKNELAQLICEQVGMEHELSVAKDEALEKQIYELNNVVENQLLPGILSIQRKLFFQTCESLLKPDRQISLDEYSEFEDDYAAYKALKGNHRGDTLHTLVVEKFNQQLSK